MKGSLLFTLWQYFLYVVKAKNSHSLHSPFLFNLYNQVIKKARKHRITDIEHLRKQLKQDRSPIEVVDFKTGKKKIKMVSQVARTALSGSPFSSFLHLLVGFLDIHTVLETGTSLGINAAYLGRATKKVVTIEGSFVLAELAAKNLERLSISSAQLIEGDIYEAFVPALVEHRPELVFLDADHRGSAIDFYLEAIMEHAPETKCIVIHDIYWSRDMKERWQELVRDTRFSLTVDVFQAGLIFPGRNMPKQHFVLRF